MAETIMFHLHANPAGELVVLGATEYDNELLRGLPRNREGKMEVTFPRDLVFHKKFFALLRTILDYMLEEDRLRLNIHTTASLLSRLKIDLGLYDVFIHEDGKVIYVPQSISFARMDEAKFGRVYKDTIGVAIQKYVPNQSEDSIDEAVRAVLRFD